MGPRALRRPGIRIAAALLAGGLLAASPASATSETLRRSIQNIALAPLDLALAPCVAGRTLWYGMREGEDSAALRWSFALPGFVWISGVQAMVAVVREVAGLVELPIGLALLFTEQEFAPLFSPAEIGEAFIDLEAGALRLRAGIDYTTPARQRAN